MDVTKVLPKIAYRKTELTVQASQGSVSFFS